MCRKIPGSVGIKVPRAGHVWNLQCPDLFAEMVRAWINRQPLPAGLASL
jgi:hypothetical protein